MAAGIELRCDGKSYAVESFVFPGGEVQVRLPLIPRNLGEGVLVSHGYRAPSFSCSCYWWMTSYRGRGSTRTSIC